MTKEEQKAKAVELIDFNRTYVRIADKYGYLLSDDEIHIAKQIAKKECQSIIDELELMKVQTREENFKIIGNDYQPPLRKFTLRIDFYMGVIKAIEQQ